MMTTDYGALYRELDKTGFFTDRKSEASINGFRITYNLTFTMKPSSVHVTCALPGYNRSKGNISIPKVRVVEFYPDGTAWIAQPSKLAEAIQAVESLIADREILRT